MTEDPDAGPSPVTPRKTYARPRLTQLAADEMPLALRLAPYSVKYIYISDPQAEERDAAILEAFSMSPVQKYRLMFDTLPRPFERADIVIVGGNDASRLGSFMKVNVPLLRHIPTIALAYNMLPKRRADLLNLGYDDVVNLKGAGIEELQARVLAITERYRITQLKSSNEEEFFQTASQYCDLEGLFMSQKRILRALIEAPGRFCTHTALAKVASREHSDMSGAHLRVLIHKIRPKLKPGYSINSVHGEGYRLDGPRP